MIRRLLPIVLILALPGLRVGAADELRFLAGLTFTDKGSGTAYAYLRWQAQDPEALRGWATAIYTKPGKPGAADVFSFAGTTSLQTHPAILNGLADGFPRAFFERHSFEEILDSMFGDFIPGLNITLGEKLSLVLQLAEADPDVFSRLLVLAYSEPFMAVAMGMAAIIPMPAEVATFELTPLHAANADVRPVVGRVTLDHTQPLLLPRPPAPAHLPDTTVTGHLNAKIGFTPNDDLRRATPFIFGYDLFRISRQFAEANGYHTKTPPASTVAELLETFPGEIRKLNSTALLAPDPANPADPIFVDDNEASLRLGLPFRDGDQFYYFIAARDLLGRFGTLSPGTLITLCKRMPPPSPRRVSVSNERMYSSSTGNVTTRLAVSWEAHPSAEDNPPAGYIVYRWNSVNELHTTHHPDAIAARAASILVPHIPGQSRYRMIDAGPGAPSSLTHTGATTWYTVKAVKDTSCGLLESGDSAPGAGAIRTFDGPNAGSTTLFASHTQPRFILSLLPYRAFTPGDEALFEGPTGDVAYIEIVAERLHPAIASFSAGLALPRPGGGYQFSHLETVHFSDDADVSYIRRRIPRILFAPALDARLWIRAEDIAGRAIYAHGLLSAIPTEQGTIQPLLAQIDLEKLTQSTGPGGSAAGGIVHRPVIPGQREVNPIEISVTVPPGAREYKLYKRIDGGPLVFVAQDIEINAPGSSEDITDAVFPPYGGEICYFIQWFDTHGNPSPLDELGCLTIGAKSPMPVPLLEQPTAAGSMENPQVTLRWFCPPEGVERFRVYIGDGLTPVPLTQPNASTPIVKPGDFALPGVNPTPIDQIPSIVLGGVTFNPVETGRVGANFGNPFEPGQFEITLDVLPGRSYQFYIVSVSVAEDLSERSNIESILWTVPLETPLPQVPWPARSLPPTDSQFIAALSAQVINEGARFQGIGVRIGNFATRSQDFTPGGPVIEGGTVLLNPTRFPDDLTSSLTLYTSRNGETVFPCVVYRYQKDPDTGDAVTSDIVQVSPLIEGLMKRTDNGEIQLYNPFVDILHDGTSFGVFIKDTQPIVLGSTYQYLLVRFKEDGEIDRVLKPPAVTTVAPIP